MPVPLVGQGGMLAAVFDLDRTLIDSSRAWSYTVEEAVIAVTGRRIAAAGLLDGFRWRPWPTVLSVVLDRGEDAERCARLCQQMFERSAMKRLTVFDGVGMALDRIRAARVEIGAVSRLPHGLALRQAESTGIDRFLTVLSATGEGEAWDARARVAHCLAFLECPPGRAAFVGTDRGDLAAVSPAGVSAMVAGWAAPPDIVAGWPVVTSPRELEATLTTPD